MRKDVFGGFCVVSISSFLLVLMFSNMFAAETNSEPAQLLATAQKAAKEDLSGTIVG
ncbi:MAG TPA: hypothetical protein PKB02_17650 [Anaerohalosphaeraceae bacterium]|nr:hypothetical protein [Anaerohalosphaeraceae bacterium]